MHHQLLIANMPTKVGVAYTDLGYVLTLQFCDLHTFTVIQCKELPLSSPLLATCNRKLGEGLE